MASDAAEGCRGGGTIERAEVLAREDERSKCEKRRRERCVDVADARLSGGVAGAERASKRGVTGDLPDAPRQV